MNEHSFCFNAPADIEHLNSLNNLVSKDVDELDADYLPADVLEESDEFVIEDPVEVILSDSEEDDVFNEEFKFENIATTSKDCPEYCEDADFYIGRNGTKWRKTPWPVTRHKTQVKFLGVVGQEASSATNELDCWRLFFDDEIINLLVENTNIYIAQTQVNFGRERDCKETDKIEMEAFFGLLYLAGLFRGGHPDLSDLWSNDGFGIDLFRMTMAEKRFRFLLTSIRFDNIATRNQRKETDKLAAVRDLFERFLENCRSHYILGQNVTIDQIFLEFRGKCGFRQCIPSKPGKYGLKIIYLRYAKLPYTYNMEIYCDEQPEGPYRQKNSVESIVTRLVEPIVETGRTITAGDSFTSLKLVNELKSRNLSYVGIIRTNMREVPLNFITAKTQNQHNSLFGYRKGATLVSYVPKKGMNILLISSHHTSSSAVSSDKEKKPEILEFYNDTISDVNDVNKLCSTYNTARSTKNWPMILFYHLVNVGAINSRVIALSNKMPFKSRRDHLKQLGLLLITPQLQRRSFMTNLPTDMQLFLQRFKPNLSGVVKEEPSTSLPSRGKRKYCEPCYKESKKQCKTQYVCEHCKSFLCLRVHTKPVCQICFDNFRKLTFD